MKGTLEYKEQLWFHNLRKCTILSEAALGWFCTMILGMGRLSYEEILNRLGLYFLVLGEHEVILLKH